MESFLHSLERPCFARSTGLANSIVTGFIQTLLTSYCNIANGPDWPKDYSEEVLKHGPELFDFIVIGAGAAGPVVAGRLAENSKIKVLLIEAGDDPPIESEVPGFIGGIFRSKFDYAYTTRTNNKSCLMQYGQACEWPRGKMVGGSTGLNAMLFIRGNRRDYDIWEKNGNPTWGWDSVFKYFKKTEDYLHSDPHHQHGVGGPLKVSHFITYPKTKNMIIHATVEGGYDHVDAFREGHDLGFSIIPGLAVNGVRNTPAKAFLLRKQPNLKLMKNSRAVKINFDKNKRATSVDLVYTDKLNIEHNIEVKAIKEIIVSGGVVDTPKLLMLSGIGPRKHLHDLKIPVLSNLSVGRNLQDHATAFIFFRANSEEEETEQQILFDYFIHREGSLAGITTEDAVGYLDARNETNVFPTVQIHPIYYKQGQPLPSFVMGTALNNTLTEVLKTSGILAMALLLLNPKSKGYIKLRSVDHNQQPIIYPNYLSHPDDMDKLIRTIQEVRKLEQTPTFKKRGIKYIDFNPPICADFKYGSYEFWDCFIRYTSFHFYHPTGTAKMGPNSDPGAVVDHKLRVKGVNRLRVVDASIMPNVPSGNTMSPTIMIAEKASDFIKEEWEI